MNGGSPSAAGVPPPSASSHPQQFIPPQNQLPGIFVIAGYPADDEATTSTNQQYIRRNSAFNPPNEVQHKFPHFIMNYF